MNQSVYDVTEAIGIAISPIRSLLTDEATANYLRNLTRVVLNHISNPQLNVAEALANVIEMQGLPVYDPIISRATADTFARLHRFLSPLTFEQGSRLLTIISVNVTPVSYHLTLGSVT